MTLREQLKREMKRHKISVAKLARLADVHQDTIYKFINTEKSMTTKIIDKLFKALEKLN